MIITMVWLGKYNYEKYLLTNESLNNIPQTTFWNAFLKIKVFDSI